MNKNNRYHLDGKIKNLLYFIGFVILLFLIIFLAYKFYIQPQLNKITSLPSNGEGALSNLAIIDKFETKVLETQSFYKLEKTDNLEYNQQVLGVSSGQDAPLAPTAAEIIDPKTGDSLVLFWQQPEYSQYDFVRIYRRSKQSNQSELIADNLDKSGSYQDVDIENKTIYYYDIKSVINIAGAEKESAAVTLSATATDTTPPASPQNLTVTNLEAGRQLRLSWTNPEAADLDYIKIYRSTQLGVLITNNKSIQITDGSESYIDTDIKDNIIYYYTITAIDENGNESSKDLLLSSSGNPNPFKSNTISEVEPETDTQTSTNTNTNTNN